MTAKLHLVIILTVIAAPLAYASTALWSGEVKNSSSHLTIEQQRFFEAKLHRLHRHLVRVIPPARPFAMLLNVSAPLDVKKAESRADTLAESLIAALRDDPEMRRVTFMSGDYLHPLVVSRRGQRFTKRTDFQTTVEGLRDQIGFFPESPSVPIEDYQGYPHPQFAIATRGHRELLIRVPLVADGYYLGDVTAEYVIK